MTQYVDIRSALIGAEAAATPLFERPPLPASEWPATSSDGSLVIDSEGKVCMATPEQQRIAVAAKVARAPRREQ